MSLSPVQEFYKGQTILITGGTGFMGKVSYFGIKTKSNKMIFIIIFFTFIEQVLIEKLLYSCSELKEILILMRPKRGKVPEARLEDMFKLPVS